MIKKLIHLTVLFLLTNSFAVFPQSSISFSEIGLNAALMKAKTENKPLLLWSYTTWCPHCKIMKEEVFTNQKVADFFNKSFICIRLDMEKGEGVDLKKDLNITSFPTFIFYNPDGIIIYRVEGEFKPGAFIQEGENALTQKKQLPYLKLKFEKDISNSLNCYEYLRALKKGGMDFSTVVKNYFVTQNNKQLLSEINWRIISNGVSDINSREMKFVIDHQSEFKALASPERVKRKLDYLVKELLNPLVESNDTLNYRSNRTLAAGIHSFSTDSLIFNFDLRIWLLTKNWNAYFETCRQSAKTFAWSNPTQLYDIAVTILNNISAPEALLLAEQWAQRSLSIHEDYDTFLLCSRLYKKLNNTKEAINMANKGKELSAKYGWKGIEAENLLKELNDSSAK